MKKKKPKQTSKESLVLENTSPEDERSLECSCNAEDVLPWWFPWFVVMVTTGVRIYYVYQPESWWILHPDEVFQSVEVAFADVYGYGFYPYEYLPPPTNISIPAEKQLAKMGMYSLRSFLYPKMFSLVMDIARWCYLPLTPFMVCRIFNVVVTSSLPLAVYQFVRRILRCHLVSCLACALTACIQLTIFGTHCIVNSFTAPFLFYGLALCLPSHERKLLYVHKQSHRNRNRSPNINSDVSRKFNVLQEGVPLGVVSNGALPMNGAPVGVSNGARPVNGVSTTAVRHSVGNTKENYKQNSYTPTKCGITQKKEIYAKGIHSLKNRHAKDKSSYSNWNHTARQLFGGMLLATVCYIRPDTALFVGIIYASVLLTFIALFQNLKLINITNDIFMSFIGAAVGVVFGVAYDCWRYRSLVIPPLNWIKFNILTTRSSALFGSSDHTEYTKLIFYSRYDDLLFVSALLFYSYKYLFGKTKNLIFKLSIPMQIAYVFLIICYCSIRHKEARFLHNFIVLYLILIAYGIHILVEIASQAYVRKSKIVSGIILFLLSFSINTFYCFPSVADATIRKLTYKNALASKDVNVCLDFISREKNVKGVMIDASIFESHAFSILQHDVPLLTKIHNEYRLYKRRSERQIPRTGVRVLSDYNDFIDAKNSQYLLRLLSIANSLNYIVTNRESFFKVLKYNEIFKSGKYSVLLRNLSITEEKALNKMAETLPLGTNATILEYETNWLLTSGLYELALARAKMSLELNQSRVRVFQQLMVAYAKMENWSEVKKYQSLCYKMHGQQACETQQEKVVLHNEYRQFEIS